MRLYDSFKSLSKSGPSVVWKPIWLAFFVIGFIVLILDEWAGTALLVGLVFGWQMGTYGAIRGFQKDPEGWNQWRTQ